MKTKAQALREAGLVIAKARSVFSKLTSEEAARRAFRPGGPSVGELAERISESRTTASGRRAA